MMWFQTVPGSLALRAAAGWLVLTTMAISCLGEEIAARWKDGGQVTVDEYQAWAELRAERQESTSLEGYVLTHWLAEQARAAGLDRQPWFEAATRFSEERRKGAALQQAILESVEVTGADIDELVATYPDAFRKPWRRRVRMIFKRVDDDAEPMVVQRAREEMEELRARVSQGADFAALAMDHSDSQTRFRGGHLGLVKPGLLPQPVEAAVKALGKGDLSEVIASPDGYLLFYCEDAMEADNPSPAEVRERFEANLRKQRFTAQWEAIEDAIAGQPLEYFARRGDEPGAVLVSGTQPPITTYDLEEAMSRQPAAAQAELTPERLRARLERLARARLLASEANRRGIELDSMARRQLELEAVERLAVTELESRLRPLVERPSEAEVKRYFDENPGDFLVDAQYELSLLRVTFDGESEDALRAATRQARGLATRLIEQPEDFAGLAKEHSDLRSSAEGGYIGWIAKRTLFGLGPNLSRVIERLTPGEVSPEVREKDSFWIARLHEFRPSRPMSFDEGRVAAERRVGQLKLDEIRTALERALLDDLEIEDLAAERLDE